MAEKPKCGIVVHLFYHGEIWCVCGELWRTKEEAEKSLELGAPTRKIWYYELDPGRNLGKTNPLNDDDLAEFVKLQRTFADSPKSWSVDVKTIDKKTFDLSVKNPNGAEEIAHRSPQEIIEEIAALDAESAEVLGKIRALL
jgi:type I restriction enzyme M protein